MTFSGWIFMLVSWAAILGMFAFCMSRTLRPPKQKENQPPDDNQ